MGRRGVTDLLVHIISTCCHGLRERGEGVGTLWLNPGLSGSVFRIRKYFSRGFEAADPCIKNMDPDLIFIFVLAIENFCFTLLKHTENVGTSTYFEYRYLNIWNEACLRSNIDKQKLINLS